MSARTLALPDGLEGRMLEFVGEILTFEAPRAYAPGQPLTFGVDHPEGPIGLSGKTIGSKRIDERRFEVRVRLVSLRRRDRERLAQT